MFLQLSLRTSNQDASQRDLRSFFSPVSHTRSFLSTCASKKEECVKTDPTHVELVSVVDSDDDDDNKDHDGVEARKLDRLKPLIP